MKLNILKVASKVAIGFAGFAVGVTRARDVLGAEHMGAFNLICVVVVFCIVAGVLEGLSSWGTS